MRRSELLALASVVLAVACACNCSSPPSFTDAGGGRDASTNSDSGGTADAGTPDAGDAGSTPDAGSTVDAGPACVTAPVTITFPASLQAPIGGKLLWNGESYASAWSGGPLLNPVIFFGFVDVDGTLDAGGVQQLPLVGMQDVFPDMAFSGTEYGLVYWADTDATFSRVDASGVPIAGSAVLLSTAMTTLYPTVAWNPLDHVWMVAWSEGSTTYLEQISAAGALLPSTKVSFTNAKLVAEGGHPLVWNGAGFGLLLDAAAGLQLLLLDRNGATQATTQVTVGSGVIDAIWSALAWTGTQYGVAWQSTSGPTGVNFAAFDSSGALMPGSQNFLTSGGLLGYAIGIVWTGAQFDVAWDSPDGSMSQHVYAAGFGAQGELLWSEPFSASPGEQSTLSALEWNGCQIAAMYNGPALRPQDISLFLTPPIASTFDAGRETDGGVFDAGASPAVAYQIDVAHTGNQPNVSLAPPLVVAWSVTLGGAISYPLILGDEVIVTVVQPAAMGPGTQLLALDATSGATRWGPIDLGGGSDWSALSYDQGTVFALNQSGTLQAFDAATGALRWNLLLPTQNDFSSAPTASQGTIYVSGNNTLFAVSESSGTTLWTAQVNDGDESSPTIGFGTVFVSYSGQAAYAFDLTSGSKYWQHFGPGTGAGGRTTVLAGSRLYARDPFNPNLIYDSVSGTVLGSFDAGPIPAFGAADAGYFVSGSTLSAQDEATGTTLWSFVGDGALVTAPLVVNGLVYVGSGQGNLYAVDPSSGNAVWTLNLDGGIAGPDETDTLVPLTGMAAGQGLLVIPVGQSLVALH